MTHSVEYLAVLESDRWKAMSEARRKNDFCEVCKTRRYTGPLQLHHLHYWTLGREEREDTIVACERCHKTADLWRRAICDAAEELALLSERTPREIVNAGAPHLLHFLVTSSGVNATITALELGSLALHNLGKLP